jgi:hypothetical protein
LQALEGKCVAGRTVAARCVVSGAAAAAAADTLGSLSLQVRFCRDRFSPTGE